MKYKVTFEEYEALVELAKMKIMVDSMSEKEFGYYKASDLIEAIIRGENEFQIA